MTSSDINDMDALQVNLILSHTKFSTYGTSQQNFINATLFFNEDRILEKKSSIINITSEDNTVINSIYLNYLIIL